jgi:hypothetical protein
MFASKTVAQVVFPDGAVNIRKLSALSLEKASAARQISVSQLSRSMGPELMKAFAGGGDDDEKKSSKPKVEPTMDEQRKARYTTYDRQLVIQAGVVSWTYPERLSDGLEDLDEETAQKLHEAILDLSLPPIDPVERDAVHSKD